MDCRRFLDQHVAYVDGMLAFGEMEAMDDHQDACGSCARHDTAVRRGLMLARSLPSIRTSDDFMARLQARLVDVRPETPRRLPGLGSFAMLAAGIVIAAWAAYGAASARLQEPIRMAPVVASLPEPIPGAIASDALLASVGTGMPVWHAVMQVGQAQMHLANLELGANGDH